MKKHKLKPSNAQCFVKSSEINHVTSLYFISFLEDQGVFEKCGHIWPKGVQLLVFGYVPKDSLENEKSVSKPKTNQQKRSGVELCVSSKYIIQQFGIRKLRSIIVPNTVNNDFVESTFVQCLKVSLPSSTDNTCLQRMHSNLPKGLKYSSICKQHVECEVSCVTQSLLDSFKNNLSKLYHYFFEFLIYQTKLYSSIQT